MVQFNDPESLEENVGALREESQAIRQYRGFSDVEGYYDQPQFPDITQEAIPAGLGQPKGVPSERELPPSVVDMARMSPNEVGSALVKNFGERPTSPDLKRDLHSKAQTHFSQLYPQADAKDWAEFDTQFDKDPNVLKAIQAQQKEYDDRYDKAEKMVTDTRERKGVLDKRFKAAREDAKKKIDLLADDKKKPAMTKFLRGLAEKGTIEDEEKIAGLLNEIPSVAKVDTKGALTQAGALKTIGDAYSGELGRKYKNKALLEYLRDVERGMSRSKALQKALKPPASENKGKILLDTETGRRERSDGVNWNEVTP